MAGCNSSWKAAQYRTFIAELWQNTHQLNGFTFAFKKIFKVAFYLLFDHLVFFLTSCRFSVKSQ